MTKPMSPLRQRMLDDMAFRNMSSNTMKVYTYAVGNFAKYHRQSPTSSALARHGHVQSASGATRPLFW